jgi:2-methylcitrate dehydratase PrpD
MAQGGGEHRIEREMSANISPTLRFAQHAATLRYEELPKPLIKLLKQCVLDTLGVSIAASTLAPEAQIVRDYVTSFGGRGKTTLWGYGNMAPAPWAVFLNGSLGHMVDYDDVGAGGHVSICTVPVAFAVAEERGGIDGKAFLTALAAGTDMHTRLNAGIPIPDWTIAEGWFPTQMFGYLSGAATAARLYGCDETAIENAFGIAFTQLSGSRQMAVGEATHLRAMQAGFSGQGALMAVDPDWEAIVGGLGSRFPLLDMHGFKVWPACGYTRPTNTAIRELRTKHGLLPDEVESITIIGGTGATQLLSEPLEKKRRPKLSIDGKFSIPFTSAVMMVKGNVTLRDYTEDGLRDPKVLAMADRVSYRLDPAAELPVGGYSSLSRPTVEIVMKDGRTYSCRPDGVPGDPNHPVSDELLETKFRDCMSFSARRVPSENVERAIELVRNLESVPDVTQIIRLLVP